MSKKRNIPLSRADHIRSYRKKNSAIRHEYYTLASKYSDLDKYMFNFTVGGRGRGVYTKLRLINEIKSYVTYLIANSTAEIYFFSNIEVGHKLSNPHLHTQIWSDDLNAVSLIYERVIAKFGLDSKRCKLSEPQRSHDFYNYVIKDYSKDLNDDEVWNLEQTKRRMRKTLGLKLRFYSRSKSKYTSKLYRMVYHTYSILRAFADSFIDFLVSTFFVKKSSRQEILDFQKESFVFSNSSFITIKNKAFLDFGFFDTFSFFYFNIEVLFYSPSVDPPIFITLLLFILFDLFVNVNIMVLGGGSLLTSIGLLWLVVFCMELLCCFYIWFIGW